MVYTGAGRRMADEYAMDTEQGDASARGGGIRRWVSFWGRALGEPRCGRANRDDDRPGCAGRAHCAPKKPGDARGRAARHPRRPHDRERVFHVFRGCGDGVTVAAGLLFCTRGDDGFPARAGDEGGAFGLGGEGDVADVVGTCPGWVALEPRDVCRDEVTMLFLSGFGAGANARTGGASG